MLSRVLGAVGVVLLIVGVIFAVRPVHVNDESCGSVFSAEKGITPMQCDTRLNTRTDLAVGFGIGGLVALVAAFSITAVRDRNSRVSS